MPCVLSAFSISDIENIRSRVKAGRLRCHSKKRWRRLGGIILEKDVAERKRAESDLRRSNGTLKAVAASATEMLRSPDFDRSIPNVLELIGQAMGVSRVHIRGRRRG